MNKDSEIRLSKEFGKQTKSIEKSLESTLKSNTKLMESNTKLMESTFETKLASTHNALLAKLAGMFVTGGTLALGLYQVLKG
jgi:hypothetical protein